LAGLQHVYERTGASFAVLQPNREVVGQLGCSRAIELRRPAGDAVYGRNFDARSRAVGVIGVQSPRWASNANSIRERVVRSIRIECLDHLIVINDRHLRAVLTEFIGYQNHDRPHRTLALTSPVPSNNPSRDGRSHRWRFWAVCTTPTGAPLELGRLLPSYGVGRTSSVGYELPPAVSTRRVSPCLPR
jgi:Integrase core domain